MFKKIDKWVVIPATCCWAECLFPWDSCSTSSAHSVRCQLMNDKNYAKATNKLDCWPYHLMSEIIVLCDNCKPSTSIGIVLCKIVHISLKNVTAG